MTPRSELVPNAPLRERFLRLRERDGLTYVEIARRCGWYTAAGRPDKAKVMNTLGLDQPQRATSYDNAAALAQALGLDPHEAGI